MSFHQNRSFTIATPVVSTEPYHYPYHQLDLPQRFGSSAFWTVDPGQSSLTVWAGAGEARIGTDNLWWGPARRYPIVLGNSAGGFPRVEIGLHRPVGIGIGDLRAHLLWGQLEESDFFDADEGNDRRLLTGFFLELTPARLSGLTLGVAGLQHNRWNDRGGKFLNLFTFAFNEKNRSAGNGLLSVTVDWSLPESGFEVYSEWAREDFWLNTEDLLTEPDHSQGYTLGFEKLANGDRLRLSFELTHLGTATVSEFRTAPFPVTFYEHAKIRQGHTHRGQLLGSWVGPGSNAEYLALDLIRERRTAGVFLERVRHDDDAYYADLASVYGSRGHDLELTLGLQGLEEVGPVDLRWEGGLSRRKNRSFIGMDGINREFLRETNLSLTVSAFWVPPV